MSERTEVEVVLPLHHVPSREQHRHLLRVGWAEAAKLVTPGRVLGLVSTARGVDPATGRLALRLRFVVTAPESAQPRRTSFGV